jgi:hypothetical protein
MRHQLRLALRDLRELLFKAFGYAYMKRASRLAQQRAISRAIVRCNASLSAEVFS